MMYMEYLDKINKRENLNIFNDKKDKVLNKNQNKKWQKEMKAKPKRC